ncbi:MAG: hypothetical protein U1E36_02250 [Rickettsiales bacterium]
MGSPVFSKTDKHPVNAQAAFDAVELERLQKAIKASEAATNVPEPAQPG